MEANLSNMELIKLILIGILMVTKERTYGYYQIQLNVSKKEHTLVKLFKHTQEMIVGMTRTVMLAIRENIKKEHII